MRVRCRLLISALFVLAGLVSGQEGSAQEGVVLVEVLIFAEDREMMSGYWYTAQGVDEAAPAVLLLHMLNGRAQDWLPLPDELARAGIHALAVDLRGHGESGGVHDWSQAQRDVTRWWQWLGARPDVDAGAMAVMGASIGANLALLGCAEWEGCRGAFALSPGRDYRGLQPELALVGTEGPPATILAARGDGYSAESSFHFAVVSGGEIRLWLLPGRAHGTRLFTTEDGERIRAALLAELELLLAEGG